MNLPVLKYFIVISECKSFTKASERLFITQPTLSRQIQDLEEEMGVLLLQRGKRTLTLTDAGKRFLQEAKEIVRRCDHLQQSVQETNKIPLTGTLRIAYQTLQDPKPLYLAVKSFIGKYPSVDLRLMRSNCRSVRQDLLSGKCDLAFVMRGIVEDYRELSGFTLRRNPLQIVVSRTHPLAIRQLVDLDELAGETFLLPTFKNDPAAADCFHALLRETGFTPGNIENVDSVETALLMTGLGNGIMFLLSGVKLNLEDLHVLEVNGVYDGLDLVAVYRKNTENPATDLFIRELTDMLQE